MEGFFYKYRKMLLFGSVFMLLCFFYEIYNGIEIINSGKVAQGTGAFLNAVIFILLSIYFFISVRKAVKAAKEKDVTAVPVDQK